MHGRMVNGLDAAEGIDKESTGSDDGSETYETANQMADLPLSKDVYGAGFLATVQFACPEYGATLGIEFGVIGLLKGLTICALGAAVQWYLVIIVNFFSNARAADNYETGLEVLTKDLRNALATGEVLASDTPNLSVCLGDHSVPWSQAIVIFVWLCKIMPDISDVLWESYFLYALPSSTSATCLEVLAPNKIRIVNLRGGVKLVLFLLFGLPKLIVVILATYAGMAFLMYCEAVGVLILKAIGLSFITAVPAIVFQGLASRDFLLSVTQAVIRTDLPVNRAWNTWGSMTLKTASILTTVLWYCRIYNAHLQSFRDACFHYKYQFVFPQCDHCGLDFFGFKVAN